MLDGTHETFELETLGHPEQPLELLLPELHLSAVHEVQQHPGLLEGNVLGEERTVNGGMLGVRRGQCCLEQDCQMFAGVLHKEAVEI